MRKALIKKGVEILNTSTYSHYKTEKPMICHSFKKVDGYTYNATYRVKLNEFGFSFLVSGICLEFID